MGNNMLIGQSGGPTAAINASLSGAIRAAMSCGKIGHIYGTKSGIEGVLKNNIIELAPYLKSEMDFRLLEHTPAMALGSCRFKLPDWKQDDSLYVQIAKTFDDYDIGYFFYIGGNDSMDTVRKLNDYFLSHDKEVRVIGIPKTIDNDLNCTDHTPGFGSAAKYVATSMLEISRDSSVYDLPSVTIVEIMGRNAGWLTASAVLARQAGGSAPHLLYLPEVAFDVDQFVSDVSALTKTVRNVVVAVSEGVRLADGSYAAEAYQSNAVDVFGHKYLSGIGRYLEQVVRERIGCKVRSVELNVMQRCAVHISSKTDLQEAREIGRVAVQLALAGESGVVPVMERVSNHPYLISYTSRKVEEIANYEKKVPKKWITPEGNDVTEDMVEYLRPLIVGEAAQFTKNGLPIYFSFEG